MIYDDEDKARTKRTREKEAIALAMQSRWREAIAVNRALLELFPTDVEAHNRLGRALMELGEYTEARQAYSQALELDPNNSIASKNLGRLVYLAEAQPASEEEQHKLAPHLFLQEAGKAAVVDLVHLAPREVIAKMATGNEVQLKIEGRSLMVGNGRGEYLGQLDPKHGLRLIELMKKGNIYTTAIANLGEQEVKVIITETYQHPSLAGHPSFSPKAMEGFRPYIKDSLIRHELEVEEEFGEEGEEEDNLEKHKFYHLVEEEAEPEAELGED